MELSTVASCRIAKVCDRSGAYRAIALIHPRILKSFGTLMFYTILWSLQVFGLSSLFLINLQLRLFIDGKSSQVFPVDSDVPQGSIRGPTLFLLYTDNLSSEAICIAAMRVDDLLSTVIVTRHNS